MAFSLSRRGRTEIGTAQARQFAYTGETRDALIAHARQQGWDVVGHRCLRMNRGPATIEVWFTDITARVVKARHHDAQGQVHDADIIRHRDLAAPLSELVLGWLDSPLSQPTVEPGAVDTLRTPHAASAAQSVEFEALGHARSTTLSDGSERFSARRRATNPVHTGVIPS